MSDTVRVTVEKISEQGKVVSKVVVIEKEISKPEEIIDIGFRHSEQVDILKSIQDEYISQPLRAMESGTRGRVDPGSLALLISKRRAEGARAKSVKQLLPKA
jgi:hypothetical protein